MTPNKLPPLPEPAFRWTRDVPGTPRPLFSVDQMRAYAADALRQSQSLPAGAVSDYCKVSGCVHKAFDCPTWPAGADPFKQALQADAREKGEAVPVGWKVIRLPDGKFPDLMIVRAPSGDEAEVIQGDDRLLWDYFAAVAATQPAQASEAAMGDTNAPDRAGAEVINVRSKNYEAGFKHGMEFEAAHRLLDALATSSQETASE